jgi:hypothetical protein
MWEPLTTHHAMLNKRELADPPVSLFRDYASPAAYFLSCFVSRLRRNATMSARSDVLRT